MSVGTLVERIRVWWSGQSPTERRASWTMPFVAVAIVSAVFSHPPAIVLFPFVAFCLGLAGAIIYDARMWLILLLAACASVLTALIEFGKLDLELVGSRLVLACYPLYMSLDGHFKFKKFLVSPLTQIRLGRDFFFRLDSLWKKGRTWSPIWLLLLGLLMIRRGTLEGDHLLSDSLIILSWLAICFTSIRRTGSVWTSVVILSGFQTKFSIRHGGQYERVGSSVLPVSTWFSVITVCLLLGTAYFCWTAKICRDRSVLVEN